MFPISTLILFGSLAAPTCCKKTKTGRGGQYIHTNDTDTDLTGVQMWGGNWGHGNWNHQWGGQSRGSGPTHSAPPVNGHSARPVVITTSTPPVVQNTGTDTVPTMSTAQPPPEPSQSSTGGGGSGPTGAGGAAGVGVDGSSGLDASSFTGINWYFDWDVNALPNMGSLEYVPNVHGQAQVSTVKAASAKWQGVKYVLGFNEPDQSTSVGGSGIDAQTAATLHQQWVSDLGGSYSIGTPAVARGGKQWMTDWIAACNGKCKFDFVAFHFYGTDANDLISYAQDFYNTFKKPLWLTEFACKDYSTGATCPDAGATEQFMKTAIDWFNGDGKGIVERWAWFGAFPAQSGQPNGIVNTDGSANALGLFYASQ